MPDYSKSKIYKLTSESCDEVYYGSTTRELHERLSQHKYEYNLTPNHKVMLQYENCKIILVENFPCSSREELSEREEFYIRNNPCVNIQIPNRPHQEVLQLPHYVEARKQYALTHRAEKREYDRVYSEINREKKLTRDHAYYHSLPVIECDCGGRYKPSYKNRHLKSIIHLNFTTTTL
jgi:hypothetical protein